MEYYYCKKDKYNNIHSIDNVIITYFLTCTLDFAVCDSLSCPNSALIFVRQLLISLPQLRLHFRGFLPRIYFTQ